MSKRDRRVCLFSWAGRTLSRRTSGHVQQQTATKSIVTRIGPEVKIQKTWVFEAEGFVNIYDDYRERFGFKKGSIQQKDGCQSAHIRGRRIPMRRARHGDAALRSPRGRLPVGSHPWAAHPYAPLRSYRHSSRRFSTTR
jgi:hypothetical protein